MPAACYLYFFAYHPNSMKMKIAGLLLLLLLSFASARSQSSRQRLIAKASYSLDTSGILVRQDSVFLKYSGLRHSRLDPNWLDFFYSSWGGTPGIYRMMPTSNNIDSGEKHIWVEFDSLYYFRGGPVFNEPFALEHIETYKYDGVGRPQDFTHTFFWSEGQLRDSNRQVAIYENGQLDRMYWLDLSPRGGPDTPGARYLIRDNSGRIITDSLTEYRLWSQKPYMRTRYGYNAAGQYVTRQEDMFDASNGAIQSSDRRSYSYYPDGRVQTVLYEYRSLGAFQPTEMDSFGYLPGVPGYIYMKLASLDTFGKPLGYYTYYDSHINTANQKDFITWTVVENGQSFTMATEVISYNRYGNPDSKTYYHYTTGITPAAKYFYYYEFYNPTGLPESAKRQPDITISPNPTTGAITLHYPDAEPGKRLSISISNAAGQLLRTETFNMQGTSQQMQLGPELPAGTYYISVIAGSGTHICTKPIVRL